LITIAHAAANRRQRWQPAMDAGVDFIETDLRYERGRLWVRHEHRVARLPLLYNVDPPASHRKGPWALTLGPLFVRLDVRAIPFEEVVDAMSGRTGLMLDFKSGAYTLEAGRDCVRAALETLERRNFAGRIDACGSWALLDALREMRPEMLLHYSVDNAAGWESLLVRLRAQDPVRGITIKRELLDEASAALLREHSLHFYAWNLFDERDAQEARRHGAAGIIADDLTLLRRHRGQPA
jgi:glycerophosphoryl diester phosphodiesterase